MDGRKEWMRRKDGNEEVTIDLVEEFFTKLKRVFRERGVLVLLLLGYGLPRLGNTGAEPSRIFF